MKKGYKITLIIAGLIVSFVIGNFVGNGKSTDVTNEILKTYDKSVKDHFNMFHPGDKDAQLQADLIREDVKKLIDKQNN